MTVSRHPAISDPLDMGALPSIGLEELEEHASLLTRTDRKYIVPTAVVGELTGALAPGARVLEIGGIRRFGYESTYFDTPDLVTYFDAARSRPKRFKVRTRTYVDTGLCALEVKVRDMRGNTVKHRLSYDNADRNILTSRGRNFLDGIVGPEYRDCHFRDTLITNYSRSTIMLSDRASRLTIDSALHCVGRKRSGVSISDNVLIETKSIHGPTEADRLLWHAHHRPVRVSKYSTSLAALWPELPSNKWNVVLCNFFEQTDPIEDEVSLPATRFNPRNVRLIAAKLMGRLPF